MDERSDAMHAAVALAHALYAHALAEAGSGLRLTLGRWTVNPNSINTIPGKVEFTIDVRCVDETVLGRFEDSLHALAQGFAWRGRIGFECIFSRATTRFSEDMLAPIERACARAASLSGRPGPLRLTSGAFHDAMYLAEHCPSAMIFVPSKGGISHNAAEATDPQELFLGAQALAHTVVELANR